jgi:hypothetical protein
MCETEGWVKRAEVFAFVCRILGVELGDKKKQNHEMMRKTLAVHSF